MTPLQAGEGILVTSASKHSAGINMAESEFTLLPPARLIANWTPLKISKTRTSNIVWLRCQKASTKVIGALMALPLVGFNCQLEEALGIYWKKQDRRVEFTKIAFIRSSQNPLNICPVTSPFPLMGAESLQRSLGSGALTLLALSSNGTSFGGDTCLAHYSVFWMDGMLNEHRPPQRRFDSAFWLGRSTVIAFTNWAAPWPTSPPVGYWLPSAATVFPPWQSPHPLTSFSSWSLIFTLFTQIKPKCLSLWPWQPGWQMNISCHSLYCD